jgi:hypothetical protein
MDAFLPVLTVWEHPGILSCVEVTVYRTTTLDAVAMLSLAAERVVPQALSEFVTSRGRSPMTMQQVKRM